MHARAVLHPSLRILQDLELLTSQFPTADQSHPDWFEEQAELHYSFSHQFSLWVQLQQQDLYVEGGPLGGGGGRGKGVHVEVEVEVEVEVDSRHLQWVVISIALLPVLPIDHQDLLLTSQPFTYILSSISYIHNQEKPFACTSFRY